MNAFNAPWKVMLITSLGVFFPWLKIPILLLFLKFSPPKDNRFTRIPEKIKPVIKDFSDHYFWWHFGALFGLSLFTQTIPNVDWFTFPSIFYNLVIYQGILLAQWPNQPSSAVVIVTTLQYFDGFPLLFALIDNAVTISHSPFAFIPEKIGFYLVCAVYDIVRIRI